MTNIIPTRASAPEMREALEMVDALKQAGVRFVPIPALNGQDRARLLAFMAQRLAAIEAVASQAEGGANNLEIPE